MHRQAIVAGAIALTLTGAASAQETTFDEEGVTVLDALVVTAGREPVAAAKTARAHTVITAEQLEARNVRTVAEALRQVPGLAVSDVGGQTAIRIRGAEANHVLVLIDGFETAGSAEGFEFTHLSADQIERIEVLRGPQSALWGAGATSGVINIITRGGVREGHRIETFAEGGSNGSYAGGATLRGGTGNADFSLGVAYRDEAGWDQAGKGGEKDGYRNLTVGGRANIDVTDDLSLRLTGRFSDREVDFDDTNDGCGAPSCYITDADNITRGRDLLLGAAADYRMLDGRLVHTPSLSYASRSNETITGFGPSTNEDSTLKAGHQTSYVFGSAEQHKIIGAVEYRHETFENSWAGGDTKKRDLFGTVLEYQGDLTESLFVQLGARYDWNDDFRNAATWSASASYTIHESGTRFHASAGTGITNPTFIELYGFAPGMFVGNPNLRPEHNIGFDIGVEQTFLNGMLVADLTYFNEALTDKITGTGMTVINLPGRSNRQGVELSLTYNPTANFSVRGSYTWLDAREPDGTFETRRPKHSLGLNAAYTFLEGRARVGADVTFNAGLQDWDWSDPAAGFPTFAAPKARMGDYVKVDLFGSYRVTEAVEIYGKVLNLFDADYSEAIGYASQPLTAYVGVKGTF